MWHVLRILQLKFYPAQPYVTSFAMFPFLFFCNAASISLCTPLAGCLVILGLATQLSSIQLNLKCLWFSLFPFAFPLLYRRMRRWATREGAAAEEEAQWRQPTLTTITCSSSSCWATPAWARPAYSTSTRTDASTRNSSPRWASTSARRDW